MEIKFSKVSLKFNEKFILRDISMNILEGKINAVVGPTGSGKTTILDILYGTKKIDSGSITIGD